MTLLFVDGFDARDTVSAAKWTSFAPVGGVSFGTGRFGTGSCCGCNGDGGAAGPGYSYMRKALPASAQLWVGGAYQIIRNNSGIPAGPLITFRADGMATAHAIIGVNASGYLYYQLGGSTIVTATTQPLPTSIPSGFNYIEATTKVHDTTGVVIVKVNGIEVINFAGDTKNGGASTNLDGIELAQYRSGYGGYNVWDDVYVCNGLGTVNNGFLGDVRIFTVMPTGAGTSTQFVPTGLANNWDNVNDIPPSTSTYNASATSGQRDTYAMADVAAGYTVLGVASVVEGLKSDAGAASAKAALKSGATLAYGATTSMGTANGALVDVWEQDPATSAPWTLTGVNALELGAEVV